MRALKTPRHGGRRAGGYSIDDLKASITRHGFLQPIVTGPDGEVIIGERRAAVAKELGLDPPILHRPDLNDPVSRLTVRISEELSHQPMLDPERAEAIGVLFRQMKRRDPSFSAEKFAVSLGVSLGIVRTYLALAHVSTAITNQIGPSLSPWVALAIGQNKHLEESEKIALAKKVVAGTVPNNVDIMREKVLPLLREASPETKKALLRSVNTTFQHAKEMEDDRATRAALAAERDREQPMIVIGKRVRLKLQAIERDLDYLRASGIFPLLPSMTRAHLSHIIDTIREHLDDIVKGKGASSLDGAVPENRITGLLEHTKDWEEKSGNHQ
jgi:hypothetical protein